jgi:DNA repair exonuclease SbcCD nuclease subunit
MKVAILNDTHCGVRNSSEIMMKYQERFYSEVFFPYLLENNITKILHLGDYYDNRKFINFKALEHNRKIFLEKLREYKIHMDIIPGNHDVFYKNTNELNSLKELLGHYMEEVRIIEKPMVVQYDNTDIALVPWINDDNEEETKKFLSKCKADIVGAHLEIEGFEMQAGIPCTHGMSAESFRRFDLVLTGHFHTKSTRGNINYLGSQMEFFWSDAHDPKYFHVLDTDTREVIPVQNTITLFQKIYYDDVNAEKAEFNYRVGKLPDIDNKFVKLVVVNKSDPKLFEFFVDRIQSKRVHELKIAENFEEFVGSSVEDDKVSVESTEELLSSYIDAVETPLDKTRIKHTVHELMIEAQTLDIV